VIKIFKVV